MNGRILITPRSLTEAGATADVLRPLHNAGYDLVFSAPGRLPSGEELARLLPGCDGYLAGVEKISADVLNHADTLKVIARNGAGTDNVDLDAARGRGIAVERAAGANAQGVAELALALMLCGLRQIPASHTALRHGMWARSLGREATGRNLGIVGFGAIGRRLAAASVGLRMTVRYSDLAPVYTTGMDPAPEYTDLDSLVAASDVISLHVPATPDGRPLLDVDRIAALPQGAVVINTARATLVDEAAMLDALENGQVGAYCTDVFADEPPRPSDLLAHPRTVLSAHIGGYTEESSTRAAAEAVHRLLAVLGAGR
ncbi:phosphoglycerate dehydrogenase [Streptomyces sp. MMS24-I2-30]|uniref:phosphoglycerate dehydrogenase n=1 Tax=Streptomyces sp. MMS24-I2-30 TaxID=3351564 RepID=UPI0038969AE3